MFWVYDPWLGGHGEGGAVAGLAVLVLAPPLLPLNQHGLVAVILLNSVLGLQFHLQWSSY